MTELIGQKKQINEFLTIKQLLLAVLLVNCLNLKTAVKACDKVAFTPALLPNRVTYSEFPPKYFLKQN